MTAVCAPTVHRGSRLRMCVSATVFAVLYIVSTSLGRLMVNPLTNVTPIWPAAGLALAALLHWGWREMWPALLLAAVGTGLLTNPEGPVGAIGPMMGNFLGPLSGAWLAERWARGRRFPERAVDVLGFVVGGAGGMAVVSASFGTAGMTLTGGMRWGRLPRVWAEWCVSDFVGAVVLVPALLAWAAPALANDGDGLPRRKNRSGEAVMLILVSVLGTQATFGGWPFPAHSHALEYLCAPALLWAAFRFPHRGVATAIAGLGTLSVLNTLQGVGPFAAPIWSNAGKSLLFLQLFLACVAGMTLITAAVVRERSAQAVALEGAVVQRTGQIRAELAERIRAEQAAEGSRAMLRLIIDLLPEAVWWKNRAGVYLGCNQLVAESVGLAATADIIGKTDEQLPWRPEDAKFFRSMDERVLATGRPEMRFVHRHECPDGRTIMLESCKVPLRDSSGRVVGILGTSEDITTRVHFESELHAARADLETRVVARTADLASANERLQAGEERFRRAIVDAPIPIMLYADDGEVLSINHAWTALTGYCHEQIPTIDHWVDRAYPPERRAEVHAEIRKIYQLEHAVENGEFTIRTADGSQRVWDFSSGPLGRTPDGRRLVISSVKDVTARRHGEDALREGEQRLRLALQAGAMGFWRTDFTKGVSEWDEQVQRLNGWEPGTFPGTFEAFLARIHPEDQLRVVEIGRHIVEERREFTHCYRVIWPDQSVHWLEDRGKPGLDAEGNVIALTGVTMDITERHEAEDALRAAKAEAERANAAKSEFLSRMSHELRTPLNAILGFGQLLEMGELEPKHSQSLEHILRAGRHLLALIDEVLDIARIESGQFTLVFEPVEAAEMMTEAINLLRPLAVRHDVRMRLGETHEPVLGAVASAHVLADRQRLKQVILNLLSNAVKYNRPGGEVIVTCQPTPGRRLCLEVRDTGHGLAPEDLARLFTPFERLGAERSGIEGTGIGLVIARRLVDSMGGSIRVESTVGVGSSFRVDLAAAAPPTPGLEEKHLSGPDDFRDSVHASLPAGAAPPDVISRAVLYIEDNLSNLQLIERIFERRMGNKRIALLSAMQGGLGLDLARQHRPNLILLDLQLPDLPGEEVMARLRADPSTRDIPVIILTADATARQRETLLQAGALAYLTKPLDVQQFLELVNRTLQGCAA